MKEKIITLIVVFSMYSIFAPQAKATSLPPVGYWKFDEGSGNVAYDSSGNGNTGSLVNGPQWVNGKGGGALSFNGINAYVNVPSSSSLTVSGQEITVELWFKSPTTLDSSNSPLMNIVDKGNEYVFQMGQDGFGHRYADGKIWFAVILQPSISNWQGTQTTTDHWIANTWYHLAGTYDGSYLKVYVNGVLENSRVLSGNLSATGVHPLGIGCATYAAPSAYYCFFNGVIDEVKIYNYARSAEEIWNDYSGGVAPPPPPSPVGGKATLINKVTIKPMNNLELLTPYIGLTIMLAVTVTTLVYIKKRKRVKEINLKQANS